MFGSLLKNFLKKVFLVSICSTCLETGYTTEIGCSYAGQNIGGSYVKAYDFNDCLSKCGLTDDCVMVSWLISRVSKNFSE